MKIVFIITFIFFSSLASSKNSIFCNFEEVYQNGEFQQGFFLLKDDNLRYEYYGKNLFTILFLNKNLYVVENSNPLKAQILDDHNSIIPYLIDIYSKYPDIQNSFSVKNYKFRIERNHIGFIKRLIINSPKLNLSIYFNNCEEIEINKKYLNFNPLVKYVQH